MVDLNSKTEQQADDDLTWLARNVHEWSPISNYVTRTDDDLYVFRTRSEGHTIGFDLFTRDQWLARRAELQNKPSWDDAPEWAEWLAQDGATGGWWFYSDKPSQSAAVWCLDRLGKEEFSCAGELLGNWRDTLERRPQAAKPEPSGDDWFERGELPPVGIECNYKHIDLGETKCIIICHYNGYAVCNLQLGGFYGGPSDKFTPIQTERERVASELVDVMMAVPVSDRKTASESYMSMALAIYDHLHPENKS